ncbi:alkaline phosphatase family protein [Isosphaeraceae bacterium EP7]
MALRAVVDRVIVIGLDGLEPKVAAPLLHAGELPNLARLASHGSGLARVATTSPAQTPVAWSTFATGLNPGGHGIFDFIRRDPLTYRPDLSLNRYEQAAAWLPPKAVNLRGGTPVWDLLAKAGIPSTILRCPCTYPPAIGRGRMLAGMGVPDLRGGLGTPTWMTSASDPVTEESEVVVPLIESGDGTYRGELLGPRGGKDQAPLRFELELRPAPDGQTAVVRSAGSPSENVLTLGEWSGWLKVHFKAGLLQTVRGMIRLYLAGTSPDVNLYASPINFDPDQPLFPIAAPASYARELAGVLGPYYTTGMVEDHSGLNNGRIDEYAFLDQCADAWDEREAMLLHELNRHEAGLLYCLFDTPDRVQHMFWRFREPDHPANKGRGYPAEFGRVVEDQYRRADRVVGHALESADDRTLVIALSDHGFTTFRRGFHINNWLRDNGLLAYRDDGGSFPDRVDWSKTRAYALGLGGLYLNLQGREGQGTVTPADAVRLKSEIVAGLSGLVDAETGTVAVREVKTREQLYRGPLAEGAPDLMVHLADRYRISWDSSLGGGGEATGLFEDNTRKWGGDHIIDPALVPGCLLMNRPFLSESARLLDLAPTILEALGQHPEPAMEGRSLLP